MSTPLWTYFFNPTWSRNFFLSPRENLDFTGKISIKPGKFLSFCNSGRVTADSSSSHVSKWHPALRSSSHCWDLNKDLNGFKASAMLCLETGKDTQGCERWRRNRTRKGNCYLGWKWNGDLPSQRTQIWLKTRAFNGPAETNEGEDMTNRVLASDFREKQEPPGRQSLKTLTSELKYNH